MKDILKEIKPNPYLVALLLFLLAAVTVYSITVKNDVQIEIPDYFIFKAKD